MNGEEIDLVWMPHTNKISDNATIFILYGDCKKSIRRLIKKQNRKEK